MNTSDNGMIFLFSYGFSGCFVLVFIQLKNHIVQIGNNERNSF